MTTQRKVAVVTGASSGIGHAAALELARSGYDLAVSARRLPLLETLAEECRRTGARCVAIAADVTSRADCQALIENAERELGAIDVLVNNAGFAIFDAIENASPDELESMMQTNYFGTVWCTKAVLPRMLERKRGTIVNVASIAGIMGYTRMGGYCATKFAMIGFSEALRDEVIGRGVRVALVCPGTTETSFFEKAERGKMPNASRLILGISAEKVARVIVKSAEDGRFRRIVPFLAAAYMRFREFAPNLAHVLFRLLSRMMERRA